MSEDLTEILLDETINNNEKFRSKDYIKEEYHYKIFDHNDPAGVNEAEKFIKKWTIINNLNVIISVTGGAGRFVLPSRIKTSFKDGIAKIALSTNALIITGGTSTGVMKLVGDAIAINNEVIKKGRIKLLGIACLERIKFGELLSEDSDEKQVSFPFINLNNCNKI